MSGRVLNFFEFSDKYSTGNSDSSGLDNISNAAANFEEGFDDSTYDQPQLGPKRPVSGNYEETPAGPGEGGVAAFSPGAKSGMEVPEEDEMEEEIENDESEEEIEEEDDDSGNPEGEEEEEDESEEKVEESFRLVKSFSKFVNESYDDYDGGEYSDEYSGEDSEDLEAYLGDDYAEEEEEGDWEEEGEDFGYYGANPEDYFGYGMQPEDADQSTVDAGMYPEEYDDYEDEEEEGGEMFCSSCGAAGDEYGYSCGCNM